VILGSTTPGRSPRSFQGRRVPWARLAHVGSALALGAALLAVTSPAGAIDTGHTGEPDARGFPQYYTDDAGLSLDICEDGTANCLGATDADLVPPEGEAFYWMATAELPSTRGTLSVEFALEAAFGELGEPIVFDRLRVRGDLTRAGTYTLLHPYGRTALEAGPPTQQRNVNLTEDLDCALTQGGACGGHIDSFLRSTTPQVGYLGGGDVATVVTGGTVRNELVLRAPNGAVIGRTNQFAVLGKLEPANPAAVLSTNAVDFGNTRVARQRTVRIRNLGDAPLTFSGIRVVGAQTITVSPSSTCTTANTVASGGTCRVDLAYRPGARRVSTANLVVDDDTIAGTHRVALQAMTASEVSSRRRVHFRTRRVGTESRSQRIVVENTGVLPLRFRSVALANTVQFERRTGQAPVCSRTRAVRPNGVCAIYVGFTPRSFGLKTTTLTIRSNAANSPTVISLDGRGR
jgi:hypothetical protein